jgi:hypothetical protein
MTYRGSLFSRRPTSRGYLGTADDSSVLLWQNPGRSLDSKFSGPASPAGPPDPGLLRLGSRLASHARGIHSPRSQDPHSGVPPQEAAELRSA